MRVVVGAPVRQGSATLYRLSVESAGSPVLLVLPDGVRKAELSVNGTVVKRNSRSDFGIQPFGRGAEAFGLAGLTPRDRVEVKLSGERAIGARPRIAGDLDLLHDAFGGGFWGGLLVGVFFAIALAQLMAGLALRDSTFVWYALWISSVGLFGLAIDDNLPLSTRAAQGLIPLINLLSQVGYVGFVATYLNLRRNNPRLFWIFVGASAATAACPVVIGAVTSAAVPVVFVTSAFALSMGLAIVIAVMRARQGFVPASFLAVGLLGSFTMMVGTSLRDLAGVDSHLIDSAFFDRWAIQLGFVFDFVFFSIGVAYRARFTYRQHMASQAQFREATLAAGHDPLTGLLNRRGLDEWVQAHAGLTGTVLFIDIDGFKEVNDGGGHAAGDDVLSIVARIIRHSVREQDAVSRFGGDEFVVVVLGSQSDSAAIADIVARISSAVGFLLPLGAESDTRIGISIGLAAVTPDLPFSEALKAADADTYRIKADHHARLRQLRRQRMTGINGQEDSIA
jgi:diguanylate cyclase (GGDEF)-like protein